MKQYLQDYKALLFDVDRTLTSTAREISPRLKNVLAQIHSQGIQLGVCTGRDLQALQYLIIPLFPKDAVHVVSGGALVMTSKGEVLFQDLIPEETVKRLYKELKKTDAELAIQKLDALYTTPQILENLHDHPWKITALPIESLTEWSAPLIAVYNIDEKVRKIITSIPEISYKAMERKSGNEYFDITAEGVTKARGLHEWSHLTKIPLQSVIGFGDGENDIEFLQEVGYSVAMGNAVPELQSIAQTTIGHCDQEGLVEYLEYILKGNPL